MIVMANFYNDDKMEVKFKQTFVQDKWTGLVQISLNCCYCYDVQHATFDGCNEDA